jgi:hypothetical protein
MGLHDPLGEAERLARHDPLGDLHEAVAHLALAGPRGDAAQQPPPAVAHVDAQRREAQLDSQRPALDEEVVGRGGHEGTVPRARARRARVHGSVTSSWPPLHKT